MKFDLPLLIVEDGFGSGIGIGSAEIFEHENRGTDLYLLADLGDLVMGPFGEIEERQDAGPGPEDGPEHGDINNNLFVFDTNSHRYPERYFGEMVEELNDSISGNQ